MLWKTLQMFHIELEEIFKYYPIEKNIHWVSWEFYWSQNSRIDWFNIQVSWLNKKLDKKLTTVFGIE